MTKKLEPKKHAGTSLTDLEVAYDEYLKAKSNLEIAQVSCDDARKKVVETAKHCSLPLDKIVLMVENDKYAEEDEYEEEEEDEDIDDSIADEKKPWVISRFAGQGPTDFIRRYNTRQEALRWRPAKVAGKPQPGYTIYFTNPVSRAMQRKYKWDWNINKWVGEIFGKETQGQ